MMDNYSILDEASTVAGGRDEMWEVYREHRTDVVLTVNAHQPRFLMGTIETGFGSVIQRTDYPAPMSLTEIAAEYRKSHRTFWQRLPQWRMPW